VILDLRSIFSHKSKITQSPTQDAGGRSQPRSVRAFLLDGQRIHRSHHRTEVQVTIYGCRARQRAPLMPRWGCVAGLYDVSTRYFETNAGDGFR
jgi:hypothetical protein